MRTVAYRTFRDGLAPRRTKLEIPGWGGAREQRVDGSLEQVWHCAPFSEGAQYGIEVFYPFDFELRVSTREGALAIEGDFGPPPEPDTEWPPFRNFGDRFYTFQLLLDLDPGPGMAVRSEPHPRFYTDRTGTCPIAVPALIRNFWPMLYFVVFKSPDEGKTHVFRPGEPFMQFVVVPEQADFVLAPMEDEASDSRELQSRRIHASRDTLGLSTRWTSRTKTVFDGTYRHILRALKERNWRE